MIRLEGICDICGDEHDNTSLKLSCNHAFHAECLNQSVKISHIKECPYCRVKFTSTVLRLKDKFDKLNRPPCCMILKSGKRKGEPCGVISKKEHNNAFYCGRHYKTIEKQKL